MKESAATNVALRIALIDFQFPRLLVDRFQHMVPGPRSSGKQEYGNIWRPIDSLPSPDQDRSGPLASVVRSNHRE